MNKISRVWSSKTADDFFPYANHFILHHEQHLKVISVIQIIFNKWLDNAMHLPILIYELVFFLWVRHLYWKRLLRVLKILLIISEAIGIAHHHDVITRTKKLVVYDWAMRLSKGIHLSVFCETRTERSVEV